MARSAGSTVVAVAGEDGRFDHVWRRAVELARERGASLVLFDVDAKPSPLEDPLPTAWSADGEEEQYADREKAGKPLTVADLEAVGRGPLADRVREASAAGVEAFGWLPDETGADGLAEFAAREHAVLVVVPDDPDYSSGIERPIEVVPAARS
jgi:nucleotide-binding universal stress UspA family protein